MIKYCCLLLTLFSVLLKAEHISQQQIKESLQGKILLIINFNRPHYENIPFLRNLYGPYFDNIIFYGPKPDASVQDYTYEGTYWISSYDTLVDAMKKYPDYDGYFWLNDDCALFAWNLIGFDTQKIWMSAPGFANVPSLSSGLSDIKGNKSSPFWQCNVHKTRLKKIYDQLPLHLKSNIQKNYGDYIIPWGPAEGCYIPKKYARDFIHIAQECLANNIVVEQALNFIIACLEINNCQELLPLEWTEYLLNKDCTPKINSLWQLRQSPLFARCMRNKLALFHHMKFSEEKNRYFITSFYKLMTQPLIEHNLFETSPGTRNTKSKILLVIHYKSPSYNTIDFFQQLYMPYVANIVFCGHEKDPWIHTCSNGGICDETCIKSLNDIAKEYPNYDGYFWLESECILCAWKIPSLDHAKCWKSEYSMKAFYVPKNHIEDIFTKKAEALIVLQTKKIDQLTEIVMAQSKYDVKRSPLFSYIKQEDLLILDGIDVSLKKNKIYLAYLYQLMTEAPTPLFKRK